LLGESPFGDLTRPLEAEAELSKHSLVRMHSSSQSCDIAKRQLPHNEGLPYPLQEDLLHRTDRESAEVHPLLSTHREVLIHASRSARSTPEPNNVPDGCALWDSWPTRSRLSTNWCTSTESLLGYFPKRGPNPTCSMCPLSARRATGCYGKSVQRRIPAHIPRSTRNLDWRPSPTPDNIPTLQRNHAIRSCLLRCRRSSEFRGGLNRLIEAGVLRLPGQFIRRIRI
jgi:hypothetical protein